MSNTQEIAYGKLWQKKATLARGISAEPRSLYNPHHTKITGLNKPLPPSVYDERVIAYLRLHGQAGVNQILRGGDGVRSTKHDHGSAAINRLLKRGVIQAKVGRYTVFELVEG